MSALPLWVPALLRLEGCGGDWQQYVEAAYGVFYRDFIESQPLFEGSWVRCRRDPICDGKEAGFWHCISEGQSEEQRTPDFRRCERIPWIRAIIEHSDDPSVQRWVNIRGSERRHILWLAESYIIVLAERVRQRDKAKYWLLITAYLTDRDHTRRKLRQERERNTKRP